MCPESVIEEVALPGVEALLAGTLALMTGYAQAGAESTHRAMMASKIACNLSELAAHPQLSDAMRQLVRRLSGDWSGGVPPHDAAPAALPASVLWHRSPATLQ